MSLPSVLLITADTGLAQSLARELLRQLSTYPALATSGEAGVKQAMVQRYDVCILSYRLPGIDGIEALLQLRQRLPRLPVVMVSDAGSEAVAVDAFRLGVTDYFPTRRDFEPSVVERVKSLLPSASDARRADGALVDPTIPNQLLKPTYQNRLRLIGRQLDLYSARSITLAEVKGGILVRWFSSHDREPEPLEFTESDFAALAAAAFGAREQRAKPQDLGSPLMPTGYEDCLRALGFWLDGLSAKTVQLVELDELLLVTAVVPVDNKLGVTHERKHQFLRAGEIQQLLDQAFQRRRPSDRAPGLFGSMLGRRP